MSTHRKQALLAYLKAIRPELEGSRDHRELLERVMRCVAADAGWAVNGLAEVLKSAAMRVVEARADVALGEFSRFVENLVSGKRR